MSALDRPAAGAGRPALRHCRAIVLGSAASNCWRCWSAFRSATLVGKESTVERRQATGLRRPVPLAQCRARAAADPDHAALGVFSIVGFFLQAVAHGVGFRSRPRSRAARRRAGSIPVVRVTSRGIARLIPRDETYAVDEADFVGHVAEVSIGPLDQGLPGRVRLKDVFGNWHSLAGPRRPSSTPLAVGASVLLVDRDGKSFIAIAARRPHCTNNGHQTGHDTCGNCSSRRYRRHRDPRHRPHAGAALHAARPATRPMCAPASAARRSCSTAARSCCRSSTRPRAVNLKTLRLEVAARRARVADHQGPHARRHRRRVLRAREARRLVDRARRADARRPHQRRRRAARPDRGQIRRRPALGRRHHALSKSCRSSARTSSRRCRTRSAPTCSRTASSSNRCR